MRRENGKASIEERISDSFRELVRKKDPDKTAEDLRKAVWYLNRYISLLLKEGGAE